MSQFLRIDSLLNAGGESTSEQVADSSTTDGRLAQQFLHPSVTINAKPPSLNIGPYTQPQQPHLRGAPMVGTTEYHSRELHVARSQLPFSVYDNRFWPYMPQPQSFPVPIASFPMQPLPAANLLAVSERSFIPWQRHRRSRACESCHYRKIKCEGGGAKCNSCVRFNYECTWAPMRKRGPKPKSRPKPAGSSVPPPQPPLADHTIPSTASLTPSSQVTDPHSSANSTLNVAGALDSQAGSHECGRPSSSASIGTPKYSFDDPLGNTPEEVMRRFYSDEVPQETRDTIVCYLDYFYGVCPIFHPATLLRRVVNGKIDPLLLLAMRASAARVITKLTGVYVDVDKAIEEVQQKLLLGLENPSLDYVRAVVLLASLKGGECKFTSYNSLSCLATSLVTRLGWHTMDLVSDNTDLSWDDWIETELKRRTFWVAYEIDSYLGLLSDRPMTIRESRLYVSAPRADPSWDDITVVKADGQPVPYQDNMSKSKVLRTGYVLHTFVEGCSLTALTSCVNTFLWDAKISFSKRPLIATSISNIRFLEAPAAAPMQRPAGLASLFEYPRFAELDQMLKDWRASLMRPDDMKHLWKPEHSFTTFGSLEHRHFIMRIRYFCLYAYSVPLVHILHFANRPSFFGQSNSGKDPNTRSSSVSSLAASDSIENNAIREMLSSTFSDLLNDGILAYDIVDESWNICLEAVHDIIAFIDRNSDIPLDRCDQVMPFCLFTSMTVLIRQIRRCRKDIEARRESHKREGMHKAYADLSKNVAALRRLWTMLKGLDLIWRTDGMELLLRTMQIEEVANTADLVSDLTL